MEKTVCELFAGVGGFRCGLNGIKSVKDARKEEKWKTVWFSQWEPADKKVQWAHGCYTAHFGTCTDRKGNDTTNTDISMVDKQDIPDHSLLVGGFPCQDYSVASTLATSRGIEGKKGVLWWSIRDILEEKQTPFVLLENVDRLVKSPAKQRGRDFAIILACFRDLGYTVEWRIINAADYGYQQRRRRTFIFACKNDTEYARNAYAAFDDTDGSTTEILTRSGFFAECFPVSGKTGTIHSAVLPENIGEVSESFSFDFKNSGVMRNGCIHTADTSPVYDGGHVTLGDILEDGTVPDSFFIPEDRLYYTDPETDHSDETVTTLSDSAHRTWQYIKGAKRVLRKTREGYEYVYTEGPVAMVDAWDKPARTILTSEGSFGRTTHIVRDKQTGKIRLLTPEELERIQGFPTRWTKECLTDGQMAEIPLGKRRFLMGNALVVNLVGQMEPKLAKIVEVE
jgi:DNA (cytosine-5)-methyltransferase 1